MSGMVFWRTGPFPRNPFLLLVLMGWLFSFTLPGRPALQRGARAGIDEGTVLSNEAERASWEAVVRAQPEKAPAAEAFLLTYPNSIKAAEAHYLIALAAFSGQKLERFEHHAEAALKKFPELAAKEPGQHVRWLNLLSRLAFVYSEGNRPQAARLKALELLDLLASAARPGAWPSGAWSELRRQLTASAHYAIGRSLLASEGEEAITAAVTHLEQAATLDPRDDYAYFRLGQSQVQLGRTEEARQSLARAAVLGGAANRAALDLLKSLQPENQVGKLLIDQTRWLDEQLKARPQAIFTLEDGAPHPPFWLGAVPDRVKQASTSSPGYSNIGRSDYQGPESCQTCHPFKHQDWSLHSHRWMNALAEESTVKGDFSGAEIRYMGGRAVFSRQGRRYRMRLQRGSTRRTYAVSRTIGSRFFQYYVGRLIEGPEPPGHAAWSLDHVLPFGYWIDAGEWVPVVHIDQEVPDAERRDPFSPTDLADYDRNCSPCHTTRALGDWMMTTDGRLRLGAFSPHEINFLVTAYLAESHPRLYQQTSGSRRWPARRLQDLLVNGVDRLPAQSFAVNLGVSCEACHNGARLHVEQSRPRQTLQKPRFFPSSPHVLIETSLSDDKLFGRTPENLNWICARCHSGGRPRYAGGMDTWNSTEASDAFKSACYDSERAAASGLGLLTCVQCHDPHQTIGKRWKESPSEDDERCLHCHQTLRPAEARAAHTHHPSGSAGDRCMNCHMPRINEGLQEMVRTHRIFSPTEQRMLEARQPNACNLCHLDQPLSWTYRHLKAWYGTSPPKEAIEEAETPAGLIWLRSTHQPTRLAVSDALTRSKAAWALPVLIELLDDPYLINRQFTQWGLEGMLGVELGTYGYRFYQMPEERRGPLGKIRSSLVEEER